MSRGKGGSKGGSKGGGKGGGKGGPSGGGASAPKEPMLLEIMLAWLCTLMTLGLPCAFSLDRGGAGHCQGLALLTRKLGRKPTAQEIFAWRDDTALVISGSSALRAALEDELRAYKDPRSVEVYLRDFKLGNESAGAVALQAYAQLADLSPQVITIVAAGKVFSIAQVGSLSHCGSMHAPIVFAPHNEDGHYTEGVVPGGLESSDIVLVFERHCPGAEAYVDVLLRLIELYKRNVSAHNDAVQSSQAIEVFLLLTPDEVPQYRASLEATAASARKDFQCAFANAQRELSGLTVAGPLFTSGATSSSSALGSDAAHGVVPSASSSALGSDAARGVAPSASSSVRSFSKGCGDLHGLTAFTSASSLATLLQVLVASASCASLAVRCVVSPRSSGVLGFVELSFVLVAIFATTKVTRGPARTLATASSAVRVALDLPARLDVAWQLPAVVAAAVAAAAGSEWGTACALAALFLLPSLRLLSRLRCLRSATDSSESPAAAAVATTRGSAPKGAAARASSPAVHPVVEAACPCAAAPVGSPHAVAVSSIVCALFLVCATVAVFAQLGSPPPAVVCAARLASATNSSSQLFVLEAAHRGQPVSFEALASHPLTEQLALVGARLPLGLAQPLRSGFDVSAAGSSQLDGGYWVFTGGANGDTGGDGPWGEYGGSLGPVGSSLVAGVTVLLACLALLGSLRTLFPPPPSDSPPPAVFGCSLFEGLHISLVLASFLAAGCTAVCSLWLVCSHVILPSIASCAFASRAVATGASAGVSRWMGLLADLELAVRHLDARALGWPHVAALAACVAVVVTAALAALVTEVVVSASTSTPIAPRTRVRQNLARMRDNVTFDDSLRGVDHEAQASRGEDRASDRAANGETVKNATMRRHQVLRRFYNLEPRGSHPADGDLHALRTDLSDPCGHAHAAGEGCCTRVAHGNEPCGGGCCPPVLSACHGHTAPSAMVRPLVLLMWCTLAVLVTSLWAMSGHPQALVSHWSPPAPAYAQWGESAVFPVATLWPAGLGASAGPRPVAPSPGAEATRAPSSPSSDVDSLARIVYAVSAFWAEGAIIAAHGTLGIAHLAVSTCATQAFSVSLGLVLSFARVTHAILQAPGVPRDIIASAAAWGNFTLAVCTATCPSLVAYLILGVLGGTACVYLDQRLALRFRGISTTKHPSGTYNRRGTWGLLACIFTLFASVARGWWVLGGVAFLAFGAVGLYLGASSRVLELWEAQCTPCINTRCNHSRCHVLRVLRRKRFEAVALATTAKATALKRLQVWESSRTCKRVKRALWHYTGFPITAAAACVELQLHRAELPQAAVVGSVLACAAALALAGVAAIATSLWSALWWWAPVTAIAVARPRLRVAWTPQLAPAVGYSFADIDRYRDLSPSCAFGDPAAVLRGGTSVVTKKVASALAAGVATTQQLAASGDFANVCNGVFAGFKLVTRALARGVYVSPALIEQLLELRDRAHAALVAPPAPCAGLTLLEAAMSWALGGAVRPLRWLEVALDGEKRQQASQAKLCRPVVESVESLRRALVAPAVAHLRHGRDSDKDCLEYLVAANEMLSDLQASRGSRGGASLSAHGDAVRADLAVHALQREIADSLQALRASQHEAALAKSIATVRWRAAFAAAQLPSPLVLVGVAACSALVAAVLWSFPGPGDVPRADIAMAGAVGTAVARLALLGCATAWRVLRAYCAPVPVPTRTTWAALSERSAAKGAALTASVVSLQGTSQSWQATASFRAAHRTASAVLLGLQADARALRGGVPAHVAEDWDAQAFRVATHGRGRRRAPPIVSERERQSPGVTAALAACSRLEAVLDEAAARLRSMGGGAASDAALSALLEQVMRLDTGCATPAGSHAARRLPRGSSGAASGGIVLRGIHADTGRVQELHVDPSDTVEVG